MRVLLAAMTLGFLPSPPTAADERPEYLYLLPEGFEGWICVDFGVAGAPPLTRDGRTLLIRPTGGIVRTSDPADLVPPFGDAFIEARGVRRPLPEDVYERRRSSRGDTNDPVVRHCVFFGDEDAADAAGPAPGLEHSELARGVPAHERQALVALYEATNGPGWKHRVGWLGPPGTECSWHGVGCDMSTEEPTVVKTLELFDNDLVGVLPDAIDGLAHLDTLWVFGNRLTGPVPEPILRRWREGTLELSADAGLMTDVTEIDLESAAPSLLCGQRRIVLRSDGAAVTYARRCRMKTPDDRTTYCEIKRGRTLPGEFGRLGVVLERDGFLRLQSEYSRMVIDAGRETLRVARRGVVHEVRTQATAGPMALWVVQRAIEGVASNIDWEGTSEEPECPRVGRPVEALLGK